ncbi:MAG: hypothetical protein KDA24_08230 [Deltaproteobacteria bacterium]|nr:hypothetical protein [Deltaproteobacteria bacterium]
MTQLLPPRSAVWPLGVVLLAATLLPWGVSAETTPPEGPLVSMEVLSRPHDGGTRVGLRYRITPGWHIYWENPGDSGMATSASVTTSDGVTHSALQFPGPVAFEADGLVGYGYGGEGMLFLDLPPGTSGEVLVSSRWLVCREICQPESAEVRLDVTGRDDGAGMARFESTLPRAIEESDGVTVRRRAGTLVVTVSGAASATLFPSVELEAALGGKRPSFLSEEIVNSDAVLALRANLSGPSADGALHGVLRVDRATGPTFFALTAPPSPRSDP